MKNKGIAPIVIVIVVVVVVAAAAGGYFMLAGGGGEGGGGTGGGPSENIVWSDVSSLDMGQDRGSEGEVESEGWIKVEGIGTPQLKVRSDATAVDPGNGEPTEYKMILNEETEKAWIYFGYEGSAPEGWHNVEEEGLNPQLTYEKAQTDMENVLSSIGNKFSEWSEGENITVHLFGEFFRFYDIKVNAEIDDSLFEDPTA
ncbi:hypothetical protein AKJ53_00355 [candidate division MSBL1 archaeon SCGC-AAA382F02]|uniref:Uncharacterized protein n=1 Tax=candidate division MSBL1 archaeon SCGC-AAA382F02 TaxID=1698282 RepID=A0A133VJ26_9EURY|nr:hypothetical protein AKJ53_00355 [candidate division MSBL1 archaeon SCGC-AAA382F02]